MKTCLSLMATACVALGVLQGKGEYVTLLSGDDKGGTKSFSDAGHWSDGEKPSGGKDYLVALGGDECAVEARAQYLCTANFGSGSEKSFAGRSLALGEFGESGLGGMFCYQASKADIKVKFSALYLNKGCYWCNCGASSAGLSGNVYVNSPTSDPFSFIGTEKEKTLTISAAVSGDAGTCVQVRSSAFVASEKGTLKLVIAGDNSNYKGQFKAKNPKNSLMFTSANALGAAETPVILADHGSLVCDGVATATGKKVQVEATGGCLEVPADTTASFAMTLSGDGVAKKTGAGRLAFTGTVDGTELEVSEGTLEWTADAALANGGRVTVVSGGFVSASGLLDGFAFKPMGGVKGRLAEGDVATLAATGTVEWPIVLSLDGTYSLEDAAASYPVVRIPKALKEVTRFDFVVDSAVQASETDALGVVIDTEGDLQTVSIKRKTAPVTLTVTKSSTSNAVTVGSVWSDGQPAGPGKDYLVYADTATRVVRSGLDSQVETIFEGDSLTLQGNTASDYWARYYVSSVKTTVGDLTMKACSDIVTGTAKSGGAITQYELDGNILIDATRTEGGARISDVVGNTMTISARLFGGADALLKIAPYENRTGFYHIALTGDNTAYFGSIDLEQTANAAFGTSYQELVIEDEKNLGGNPPAFTVDALKLNTYGCLTAAKSLTIDDPNRGIYVNGNGQFNVPAADDTLTVLSPIDIYGGSLHKIGPGTLKLGCEMKFGSPGTAVDPGNKTSRSIIEVHEGVLQLTKGEACSKVQLKVANAACIRIAPQAEDADETLKTKGLVVKEYADGRDHIVPLDADGAVTLDLVYDDSKLSGSFSVPVLNVTETVAGTLRGKLTLTHSATRKHTVRLVEKTLDDGSVQFCARYEAGLAISVR